MPVDPHEPPPPTLEELLRRAEETRKRVAGLKAEAEQLVAEAQERQRQKLSESE